MFLVIFLRVYQGCLFGLDSGSCNMKHTNRLWVFTKLIQGFNFLSNKLCHWFRLKLRIHCRSNLYNRYKKQITNNLNLRTLAKELSIVFKTLVSNIF